MYVTRGCGSGTSLGRKGDGTVKVYTPRGASSLPNSYGGCVGDAIEEWRSDDLRTGDEQGRGRRKFDGICAEPWMAHARVLRDVVC